MNAVQLSLVIPAYNEAARIGATLDTVQAYLRGQSYTSEILVVDDGSNDGTAEVVRSAFPAVQVITYQPNRGKGCAVRTGMLAAAGEVRVFYDADGSTPIDELASLLPKFSDGFDIVLGSRLKPGAAIGIHQNKVREVLGRAFNVTLRILGLTSFNDTQCGFKGFSAKATEICCSRQTLDGFCFDVELLVIGKHHGLKMAELPVHWNNNPESKVRPVRDAAPTLRDLLAIRINLRDGKYD